MNYLLPYNNDKKILYFYSNFFFFENDFLPYIKTDARQKAFNIGKKISIIWLTIRRVYNVGSFNAEVFKNKQKFILVAKKVSN